MNSIYLGPARSWLRRLGVVNLVSMPARAKQRRRGAEYRRDRPSRVDVRVGRARGTMLVADEVEYARVLSFEDDRHIIEAILDRLAAGDSYWDVGASIGLYSVLMGDAVGPGGTVVAFEPEPRSYRRLAENLAANGLSNVRPLNLALGRTRCTMGMIPAEHASLGNHQLVAAEGVGVGGPSVLTQVDVVPGDDVRRDEGLAVPSAVKVDVEGAEEDVLLGMRDTLADPKCRTVVCEVHFSVLEATGRRDSPRRIVELLAGLGFGRTSWLDRSHLMACR